MVQQLMAHLSAIKKDMVILEKSEFSQLKHEYEVSVESISLLEWFLTQIDGLQEILGMDSASSIYRFSSKFQKQNIELMQLRKSLADDIVKLRAGVTLDLNLEKSRSVESVR